MRPARNAAFSLALIKEQRYDDHRLNELFNRRDVNRRGSLDLEELKNMLYDMGSTLSYR